jgi:hypothetical protein
LSLLNKFAGNQTVKRITRCVEKPTEMGPAGRAESVLPGVSCKPAEFISGLPVEGTSPGLFETRNFIDHTSGIKKRMEMAIVNGNGVLTAGNNSPATAAKQRLLTLGCSVVRDIGIRHINRPGIILFPAIKTSCIRQV